MKKIRSCSTGFETDFKPVFLENAFEKFKESSCGDQSSDGESLAYTQKANFYPIQLAQLRFAELFQDLIFLILKQSLKVVLAYKIYFV